MPMTPKLLRLARPAFIQLNRELQKWMLPSPGQPRLAVLIDAENVAATQAELMLKQIQSWGQPVLMRAYADWTNSAVSPWKNVCRLHPIQTIHQHNYVKGKSTTDMALIIDAMDLLHGDILIDGFCLISGDSDFTPLAIHLRHRDKLVFGIGSQNAVAGFKNACHQFVSTHECHRRCKNDPVAPFEM